MGDLEILKEQIGSQIEGMYIFQVTYTNAEKEAFRIVKSENGYYVWPLFCRPKRTSKFKFDLICKMADGFIADTDQREFSINGWFEYDDFMDHFYNQTPSRNLKSHIGKFYGEDHGAQKKFAEMQFVQPQQVTQWLDKDTIVVGTKMYSFRRDLNFPK